jgi:hypothetical protein
VIGRHDQVGVVSVKRIGLQRVPDSPEQVVVLPQRLVIVKDAVVLTELALNAGVKVRFFVGVAQVNHE